MNSSELNYAHYVWRNYTSMNKKQRRSAIEKLAASGFPHSLISRITGSSWSHVDAVVGNPGKGPEGLFNPATLDALVLLRERWENGTQPTGLLTSLIVQNGTSLRQIAALTEIPIEILREAVN